MFAWLNRWGKTPKDSPGAPQPEALRSPPAVSVETAAVASCSVLPCPHPTGFALDMACPDTLVWSLGLDRHPSTAANPAGQAGQASPALQAVDRLLARDTLPADLLPRAAAVIPQLLSLLRQDDLPLPRIVERVAREPLLTAEVMRLARSPHYRTRERMETLEHAVAVLGASGLQSAIARVVLRPLFRGDSSGLAGRAAERAWPHATRQAELAAELAAQRGLPRLEGFLGGLLHGSGRTALWRILDQSGAAPPLPWEPALSRELAVRSHQLFGQLALEWRITSTLMAAGQALREAQPGTQAHELPLLATVVLESEWRCTQELAGGHDGAEPDSTEALARP
jgi:hypothetical protein